MMKDEREGEQKEETFHAKGGLKEFVQHLNRGRKPLHPEVIYIETTKDDIGIELALQYNDGYNDTTFSFVNNINTHEGGTHLTGLKAALTRVINAYANKGGFLKKLVGVKGEEESKKSIGVSNILMKSILLIILAGLLYLIFATWLGISLP